MIAASAGYLIGAAGPTGFPTVVEPGSMAKDANYIIFLDNNVTYVLNGTSGEVEYTHATHSTAINWALDNRPAYGGRVHIRSGDYWLTSTIGVHSNTVLSGEGPGTVLRVASGVANGITLSTTANNMVVRDLWLTGPGPAAPNANGISGTSLDNVTIEGCYVDQWSDDGIIIHGPNTRNVKIINNYVLNEEEGIEVKGGCNYTISGNHVWSAAQPLEITSREPYDNHIYDVVVSGNVLEGTERGIWLFGNVSRVVIDGNIIQGLSESGIYSSKTSATSFQDHITISNNLIQSSPYGIIFTLQTARSRDYLIMGNQFYNMGTYGIYFNTVCQNISVVGNYFHTLAGSGTVTGIKQASATAVDKLVIQANVFCNMKYAIYGLTEGQVVSCNSFYDAGGGGYTVIVTGANCSFFGNTFSGGGSTCQIYINGVKNVTVVGNSFTDAVYGVKSFTTSDYVYLIGNNFKGCTSNPGYSLTGSSNVIANNTGI